MFKRFTRAALALMMVGTLAVAALPASAQSGTIDSNPNTLLNQTNLGPNSSTAGTALPQLVGRVIRTIMSILGIIFVVLMVYAGFKWMTARGEEEPIKEAKDTIRAAIIGLILVFLAYAITGFVIDAVVKATTTG